MSKNQVLAWWGYIEIIFVMRTLPNPVISWRHHNFKKADLLKIPWHEILLLPTFNRFVRISHALIRFAMLFMQRWGKSNKTLYLTAKAKGEL